jgi:hypothetical protein
MKIRIIRRGGGVTSYRQVSNFVLDQEGLARIHRGRRDEEGRLDIFGEPGGKLGFWKKMAPRMRTAVAGARIQSDSTSGLDD